MLHTIPRSVHEEPERRIPSSTAIAEQERRIPAQITSVRFAPYGPKPTYSCRIPFLGHSLLEEISTFVQKQGSFTFLKSIYFKDQRIAQIEGYQRQIEALVGAFHVRVPESFGSSYYPKLFGS